MRRTEQLQGLKAGRPEYVQVLRLLETFELEDLHAAVKMALRLGAVGFVAVKHLVLCQVEKRPPKLDRDVYPYLPVSLRLGFHVGARRPKGGRSNAGGMGGVGRR